MRVGFSFVAVVLQLYNYTTVLAVKELHLLSFFSYNDRAERQYFTMVISGTNLNLQARYMQNIHNMVIHLVRNLGAKPPKPFTRVYSKGICIFQTFIMKKGLA